MRAKEYLEQIRTLDTIIKQKKREVADLHEIATALGSFDYSRERVQASPSGEAAFTRTAERAAELDKQIGELTDQRLRIVATIQKMEEDGYIKVLYKRYVQHKKFDQIAKEMGYSLSSTYRVHRKALEEVEDELQRRQTEGTG